MANVITYRPRSALRDAGKALGHAEGTIDAWSRDGRRPRRSLAETARVSPGEIPAPVLALAGCLDGFPRHLGVHSGGMVICDRPVVEVCPVEWATAPGRTVLQWDKDDCAAIGLVKFDLLGLGMLEALHRAVDLLAASGGPALDLAELPQEPEVYEMLCEADTVGVFQVESRAQMGTLPRLRPRCFYDLVIEVALIRPGPIQGGSVHPYLRRRNDEEEVTYLHPLLEPCLSKTLGRPGLPGAADADGHRRGRLHPGRVGPAPPGDGLQALGRAHGAAARALLRRAWPSGGSPARWPTRSSPRWPPSPTSGSPSPTRCPSPTSSTPRPG